MRIAALTDLHGKIINFKRILIYKPDAIVVSGDITHFGKDLKIIDYLKYLKEKENVKVLTVPGNCDTEESITKLNELNINIDEKCIEINNIKFIGIGGSNPTPFNTPNEYTEEELYNKFKNAIKGMKKEDLLNNFILVTHAPPKNTMADRVGGNHVGSASIRKIIEEYSPSLVICGHIHESKCIDKINNSYIVNPSQSSFLISDIFDKDGKVWIKSIELIDL
ncbi:metallophosphoesterase family protein [Methanothermococcus okinawensis]|uniref:Metallophosphoesterase n=1 Tax=Methanothermococcus okinawensis (strain DSM 14208 / JCM 11175 / IH1) TaxID=647113 RepID=F8ANQ5_METOI|nr:metallophosphoesterase [Methanothermococcus okinawensis]AEH06253.1 metallophosphoesterase [Methanothermococcus okinawensis IH1]